MSVLDPTFVERYRRIEAVARIGGRDELESLNTFGMLRTPRKQHEDQVVFLEALYRRLDDQGAAAILLTYSGSPSGTPADMHRAILDWLEATIRGLGDGQVKS